MSAKRLSPRNLTGSAVLSLLAIAGCSTVIGLGDYKVGPSGSDAGSAGVGGSDSAGASEGGSDVSGGKSGVGGKSAAGGTKAIGGTSAGGTGGTEEAGAPNGATAGIDESAAGMSAGGSSGTGAGGTSAGGHAGAGACPQGCDDGIACTIDLCDSTGCVHTPADALCNGTCMKCDVALGCKDASTTKELLTNPNLDTGAGTGWTQTSDDNLVLIKAPPAGITAVSAPNIAWLGQLDIEESYISQTIMIPAGTLGLTLSGSVRVRSTVTDANSTEVGWIDLVTDQTDPVDTFTGTFSSVWDHNDAGTVWKPFSETADLSSLSTTSPPPAQSISFVVYGFSDVNGVTDFFFDSLSLKAKYCAQ